MIVAEGGDAGGAKEIYSKLVPLMDGHTVLGHIQRGVSPLAFDRILATRMVVFAVESLLNGENKMVIGSKRGYTAPNIDFRGYSNSINTKLKKFRNN